MKDTFYLLFISFSITLSVACTTDPAATTGTDTSDSESTTDTNPVSDADADSDSDSDADSDSDSDTDSDTDADSDSDTDTDSESDTGAETDSVTDTDPGTDTGPASCADTPWDVDIKPINMLVLLDRSKSMENNQIEGKTYAQVVQDAIDLIVAQNTGSGIINFAMNVFPDADACTESFGEASAEDAFDSDSDYAKRCAAASNYPGSGPAGTPTVPFSEYVTMNTYDLIADALATTGQCGGTPICGTLKWAKTWLDANAPDGDTFVLLATDGAPSCNPNAASHTCKSALADSADPDTDPQPVTHPVQCLDDLCSFNAAYQLAVAGYTTYVVGVGDEAVEFKTTMDVLAWYGAADIYSVIPTNPYSIPNPGTHYYPAADASTLNAALENVTNSALSCVFNIDWADVPLTDPVSGVPVARACDKVNIFGVMTDIADTDTADEDNRIPVNYAADCIDEGDSLAWNWADLPGATWNNVISVGSDVARCRQVQLCPGACDALKVHNGVKRWNDATAKFGCNPVVLE